MTDHRHPGGDVEGFVTWMDQVDQEVRSRIAVRVMDLPDAPFRAWYEDGLTPAEATAELLGRGVI